MKRMLQQQNKWLFSIIICLLMSNANAQTYCTPTGGTGSTTYYLNKVSSINAVTNFIYTASSYTAYNDAYAGNSCSELPGANISIKLESSSTSTNYYYCWVDWNNDGDFTDAGETEFATTTYAAAPYNGTISIPAGQASGSFRARVALSQLGAISTACSAASRGNFVDFQIAVIAPTACTTAPATLNITPAGPVTTCANSIVQLTANLPSAMYNNYSFQWYQDGNAIPGATDATYTYTAAATSDFFATVSCPADPNTEILSNFVNVAVSGTCPPPCTPTGGTSSTSQYITKLTTTDALSNFIYTNSSYIAYNDSYATSMCVQQSGSAFNLKIEAATSSTNYYYCWVDWNNDGDFTDMGETIFATTSYASAPYNGVINIPAGQFSGSYRMRVALSVSGAITSACGPANSGCFVDAQIIVGTPAPCTVAPASVDITPSPTVSVCENSQVQFSASTPSPLINGYSFQWYLDGNPISGQTAPSYTYVATTPASIHVTVSCPADPGNQLNSTVVDLTLSGACPSPCTPTAGSSSTSQYMTKITTTNALSNFIYTASSYASYTDGFNSNTCLQLPGGNVNVKIDAATTSTNYYYCWVDWNNDNDFTDVGEAVFATTSYAASPYNGVIPVPAGQLPGTYRVRFALSSLGAVTNPCGPATSGSFVDAKLIVMNQTDCSLPTAVSGTTAADSLKLTWSWEQNIHPLQSFNVQYGMTGFALNSTDATILPAVGLNFADTIVNSNLMASGVYQVYVQAVCAGGNNSDYSGPFSLIMPATNDLVCTPESLQLGSTYTFNNTAATVSTNESSIAPPATGAQTTTGWINNTLNGTLWYTFTAPATGNVRIDATGIDYNGQAAVYSTTNCSDFAAFTLLGANDNEIGGTSLAPNFTVCGLTPGSTYYLMFDKFNTASGNFSLEVREVNTEAGSANPTLSVCSGDIANLFNSITTANTTGHWSSTILPVNVNINGSDLNTNGLAYQTFQMEYRVIDGCSYDSIISNVRIYGPSNAGQDGMINVCKNEPIDLLAGLNGNADLNGTWYDPSNNPMPNSQYMTAALAGQYNFKYISGNGVCPNDTANVVVTVGACNWLSIEEGVLEEISIYPNPSTGIVNILVPESNDLKLEVSDINGRIVQTIDQPIKSGTNTINLNDVERGTYFFKLINGEVSKVFHVVIH